MPVVQGPPSIWDYIAQAGGAGIKSYQEAKEKTRADALQNAGLLGQLFGAGAIDSAELQPAVSKVPGMGNVKIQPNAAEKKRTPGTPENIAYQAEGAESEQKLKKSEIVKRWTAGEPISEQEALMAGLPTSQDVAQMREAKADPILQRAGDQYIDSAVLQMGGRITPAQAIDISAQAYSQFLKDYAEAGLGTLSPQELKNAQRYFAQRAMAVLTKQRELDVQEIAANNRGQVNAQNRQTSEITKLIESNRKTLADFLRANPGTETLASQFKDTPEKIPPAFRGKIARYNMLLQRASDLENASSMIAMGVIPANYAQLLAAKSPTAGFDATKVSSGVAFIQSGKGKLTDLAKQVQLGRITQEEADEIERRIVATKPKPATR